jgi:hypothetical protein
MKECSLKGDALVIGNKDRVVDGGDEVDEGTSNDWNFDCADSDERYFLCSFSQRLSHKVEMDLNKVDNKRSHVS